MQVEHDLNMPDDANDEGHSTGWLDIAFGMQRQHAILRAQPHLASVSDARHRLIILFGGERAMKQSMLRLLCIDCTVEQQCRESLYSRHHSCR